VSADFCLLGGSWTDFSCLLREAAQIQLRRTGRLGLRCGLQARRRFLQPDGGNKLIRPEFGRGAGNADRPVLFYRLTGNGAGVFCARPHQRDRLVGKEGKGRGRGVDPVEAGKLAKQ